MEALVIILSSIIIAVNGLKPGGNIRCYECNFCDEVTSQTAKIICKDACAVLKEHKTGFPSILNRTCITEYDCNNMNHLTDTECLMCEYNYCNYAEIVKSQCHMIIALNIIALLVL